MPKAKKISVVDESPEEKKVEVNVDPTKCIVCGKPIQDDLKVYCGLACKDKK